VAAITIVDRGAWKPSREKPAPRAWSGCAGGALLAGLIAQTGHHTRLNETVSLRYGWPGCTLGSKEK